MNSLATEAIGKGVLSPLDTVLPVTRSITAAEISAPLSAACRAACRSRRSSPVKAAATGVLGGAARGAEHPTA